MVSILIGCIGFIVVYLFDIVSLKKYTGAKSVIWIIGSSLLTYSLVMVCLARDKMQLPVWSIWLGWVLLVVSLLLLIYSLFINLPFRKTYIAAGVSDKLITTGLYALVRHPGVHWFIMLMLSLFLVSRSRLMLVAAPIFILLDIALVIMQEKFIFYKMFAQYDDYRKKTPMLVPNRRSLNTFISLLSKTQPKT